MSRSSPEVWVAAYFKQNPTTAHDQQQTTDCWPMDVVYRYHSVSFFFCTYSIFSAKISPILLPMTTLFIIKHWQFDEVWFDLTNICVISETNSRTAVLFWSNLPLCEFWGLHCFFVCWHNPLFVPTKIHQYSPGATTTSCAPIKQVKFIHA